MVPRKKVTIQDIADRANVSKSTVSRVLNDTTPVAPEKETAVLAAIAELDYRPNIHARGLAGGPSLTIGVVTQNVGSPFYDGIMRGIIVGLQSTDFSPIFADGQWQRALEERALQTLLGRRVDGFIIVGGTIPGDELRELAAQVPVIVVARDVPEMAGRCIFTDNLRAAYEATTFLIKSGHRRIAHIMGVAEQQDSQRRRDGYLQALAEASIAPDESLIYEGNFRPQSGLLAVEALLTNGEAFSAIFAANDQMAFGARLALYRRGIRVPDDVSLVGFDDQPDSAYMTPPLTTVRQPAVELGEAAAKAMLGLLRDEFEPVSPLAAWLVIRESTTRLR